LLAGGIGNGNWFAGIANMKRLLARVCISSVFVFAVTVATAQAPERLEKIAEGEYWEWQDGHPIKDTTQSWTIWRTKEGFEIESKLPPNRGDALRAMMGSAFSKNMAPELREELQNATTTRGIDLGTNSDLGIVKMQLSGLKLRDAKPVEVADCNRNGDEISCKGPGGTARLKNVGQSSLVYSYPSPLFFVPIIKQAKPGLDQSVPVKLAMLNQVKNKLQLTEVGGQLRGKGPDRLSVGERIFDTDKFELTLETKPVPRVITLWTSKQGIVFAMEDSEFAAGHRILLTQYKRFAEF